MYIADYIKRNEGLRLKMYTCSAGKMSIGYARNLEDNGIFQNEAELMLKNDLEVCKDALYDTFGFESFVLLPAKCKTVLMDMLYNLGEPRFRTFKKMIRAVKDKDYFEAAVQIRDSKYAREDVPERAERNAKIMES